MDAEQLRTLTAVLDAGSFEAAAAELDLTPSAVSQRIRALEVRLGRPVVVRARPVAPTDAGAVLLRLARQVDLLERDALDELGAGGGSRRVSLVINSDSLATWALPALTRVAGEHDVLYEIRREDQDHSTAALRDGSAVAAVTSVADPVPGCRVRRLGSMIYRPRASRAFCERWFASGATVAALELAPVVTFDRADDLQLRWLRGRARRPLAPPVHYVPESTTYVDAVRQGLGWGMVPDLQATDDLVELRPGGTIEVPLYWQQWRLDSPVLAALADALERACPGG